MEVSVVILGILQVIFFFGIRMDDFVVCDGCLVGVYVFFVFENFESVCLIIFEVDVVVFGVGYFVCDVYYNFQSYDVFMILKDFVVRLIYILDQFYVWQQVNYYLDQDIVLFFNESLY